jgi:type VI secretion system protein VasG
MIDAILTNSMLPDISRAFLGKMIAGEEIAKVQVGVTGGEFSYAFA